jgi:trimeric autotransporter adhesin
LCTACSLCTYCKLHIHACEQGEAALAETLAGVFRALPGTSYERLVFASSLVAQVGRREQGTGNTVKMALAQCTDACPSTSPPPTPPSQLRPADPTWRRNILLLDQLQALSGSLPATGTGGRASGGGEHDPLWYDEEEEEKGGEGAAAADEAAAVAVAVRGVDPCIAAWLARSGASATAASSSASLSRRLRLDLHALLLDPWAVLRPLLTVPRTSALLPVAATLRLDPDSLHSHLARRIGGGLLRFAVVRGSAAAASGAVPAYAALAAGVEAHLRALHDSLGRIRDSGVAAEASAQIVLQALSWGTTGAAAAASAEPAAGGAVRGTSSSSGGGGLQWVLDLLSAHATSSSAASAASPSSLPPAALLSLARLLLSVRLRLLLLALWYGHAHATGLVHVAAALLFGAGAADQPLAVLLRQLRAAHAPVADAAAASDAPAAAAAAAATSDPSLLPPDGRSLWRRLIEATVLLPDGHAITHPALMAALMGGSAAAAPPSEGHGHGHGQHSSSSSSGAAATPPAVSLAALAAGGLDPSLYTEDGSGNSAAAAAAPAAASGGGFGGAYPGLAFRMSRTAAVLQSLRSAWAGCMAMWDLTALGPADTAAFGHYVIAGRARDFAAAVLHRRGAAAFAAAAAAEAAGAAELASAAASTSGALLQGAPDSVDAYVAAAAGPWLPPPPSSAAAAAAAAAAAPASESSPGQAAVSAVAATAASAPALLYRVIATVAWRYGVDLAPLVQSLVGRWLAEDAALPAAHKARSSGAASAPSHAEPAASSSFDDSSSTAPPYFAPTPAEAESAAEASVVAKVLFALSPPLGLPTISPPPQLPLKPLPAVAAAPSPSRRAPPRPHASSGSGSGGLSTTASAGGVAWGGQQAAGDAASAPLLSPAAAPLPLSSAIRAGGPSWLLAAAEAPLPPAGSGGMAAALRTQARACFCLLRLLPASPDLASFLSLAPRGGSSGGHSARGGGGGGGGSGLLTPSAVASAGLAAAHLSSLASLGVPIMALADFASCNKAAFARGLWRDYHASSTAVLLASARAMLDYRVTDTGLWASTLSALLAAGRGRECLQLLSALVRPGGSSTISLDALTLQLPGGRFSPSSAGAGSALVRADDPEFAGVTKQALWSALGALGLSSGDAGGSSGTGNAAAVAASAAAAVALSSPVSVLQALTLATHTLAAYPSPQLADPAAFAARLSELAAAVAVRETESAGRASSTGRAVSEALWSLARIAAASHPSGPARAAACAAVDDAASACSARLIAAP